MAWPKLPKVPNWVRAIFRFRNPIFVILVPLICLPLALKGGTDANGKDLTKAMQCAYILVIMAAYWVTEALPLAITSVIPIVLLPMFGIMTTDKVCKEYLKETNFMFMSGIILAIAIVYSNLHKRIALKFLLLIGTSPRRLMLGFMFITMFLSMWISNTATTAMMVPIVEAVLKVIIMDELESSTLTLDTTLNGNLSSEESGKLEETELQVRAKKTRHMIFLSVAYAANCGGTGSLTGSGSNLVLKGALSIIDNNPINFATWMAYAVVPMLLNIVICWIWLQVYYLGFPFGKIANFFRRKKSRNDDEDKPAENPDRIRELLRSQYNDLGFMTFHEIAVLMLFIFLVLLWFFREPEFMPGWGEFFPINVTSYVLTDSNCTDNCTYLASTLTREAVDDGSAGMLIVIFLFIVPKTFANVGLNSEALINWKLVEDKMPWQLVFLLGGGFALAKGITESHLSDYIGRQLETLGSLPPWVIVVVVCVCTAATTEIMSNVVASSILLPILFNMAISLRINPLYLMLPVTLCCSYAFMLPVASPPNAIVHNASGMKTTEMIKVGFVMNIVCVVTNILWLESFGVYYLELSTFPKWAEPFT